MRTQFRRLVQRGGVFYFRRRTPKAYEAIFPTGAVVVSLRTRDPTLALVRHARVNQAVERLFAMIDENGDLDANDLKVYFQEWLRDALGLNGSVPSPPHPDDTQENLSEYLRNEDGELYDVGLKKVAFLSAFEPYRDLITHRHYEALGLGFVQTQMEINRQREHMATHGTPAPTASPMFADMPELVRIKSCLYIQNT